MSREWQVLAVAGILVGPRLCGIPAVLVYLSQKRQSSLTAKKIILQLLAKINYYKNILKNPNISLKYTRNTANFLEFSLTQKGNYADCVCYLKITLFGKF